MTDGPTATASPPRTMFTVTEVAAMLGVRPVTVRHLIHNGLLAATNVSTGPTRANWRITGAALRRYLAAKASG